MFNWRAFFKAVDPFWVEFVTVIIVSNTAAMVFFAIMIKHGG